MQKTLIVSATLFLLVTGILLWTFFVHVPELNTAPADFPVGEDIEVVEGSTQSDIAAYLYEKRVINSSLYFYIYLKKHYPNTFIKAGTYRFNSAYTTSEIAEALIHGTDLSPLIKITFPEGFTVKNIGALLNREVSENDIAQLMEFEGYLFPDTYFVPREATLSDVIILLRKTFDEKIEPYRETISQSGFTEKEVVILASLIEREANDAFSMKMVSGILQNRLRIDMPLQVDAVFDYILNKTSDELTSEDLLLDSPYNTYTNIGLPPTPISNPGILSLEAVLFPTETKNLYYLTGDDGTFYYAKTFEEHKNNKQQYLQ